MLIDVLGNEFHLMIDSVDQLVDLLIDAFLALSFMEVLVWSSNRVAS